MLQETWLNDSDLNVYSEIREYGYELLKVTRDKNRGGGLLILHRPNILMKKICFNKKYQNSFRTFESIICTTTLNGRQFKLVNLYRPPYSALNPYAIRQFLEEFEILLSFIMEIKGFLIILRHSGGLLYI